MVEGLAARLAQNGGDAQGWLRLIRAYSVLHETDKARDALAERARRSAGDAARPAAVSTRWRSELGLEGADLDAQGPASHADRRRARRRRPAPSVWSLYALSDNIVFFYSPSEVMPRRIPRQGARLRIGGLVKQARSSRATIRTRPSSITDNAHDVAVTYRAAAGPVPRRARASSPRAC